MRALRWLVSCILLCGFIFIAVVSTALAQEETSAAETTMTLQSAPLLDDKGNTIPGRLLLIATLITTDNQPVSEKEVTFYESVEFMGGVRNADLGSGLTDVAGTAFVVYQPSTLDDHVVWARFDGSADYTAFNAPTMNVQVDELSPTFESGSRPLDAVRRWLPWAVAVLVLATWVVVIGAFVRAVVGIRAAKPEEHPV